MGRRIAGTLIAVAAYVAALLVLLRGAFEIAQVQNDGRTTQATVTAVSCIHGSRGSEQGNITLVFVDATDKARTIQHSSLTFACFSAQAGDTITIRYLSSTPATLLTQDELNQLPLAWVMYGLYGAVCSIYLFCALWIIWSWTFPQRFVAFFKAHMRSLVSGSVSS